MTTRLSLLIVNALAIVQSAPVSGVAASQDVALSLGYGKVQVSVVVSSQSNLEDVLDAACAKVSDNSAYARIDQAKICHKTMGIFEPYAYSRMVKFGGKSYEENEFKEKTLSDLDIGNDAKLGLCFRITRGFPPPGVLVCDS